MVRLHQTVATIVLCLLLAGKVWAADPLAARIRTDTTNFDTNLSAADTDVQKALDTIDNLEIVSEETDPLSIHLDGTSTTTASIPFAEGLTIPDNKTVGLGSGKGQIEFDDQTIDKVNILNANVGIGTSTPLNKLDIAGNMVIGATYSGTNTAPANGLLVEGNVGIGTTAPSGIGSSAPMAQLDINTGDGHIRVQDVKASTNQDAGILLDGTGSVVSGLFTEVDGQVLSYGINISQLSTPVSNKVGGIFRLDTRSASSFPDGGAFIVYGAPETSTTQRNRFAVNLHSGTTLLAPSGGNVGIGMTPSYPLDVNGVARIGGELYATSNLLVYGTATIIRAVDYDDWHTLDGDEEYPEIMEGTLFVLANPDPTNVIWPNPAGTQLVIFRADNGNSTLIDANNGGAFYLQGGVNWNMQTGDTITLYYDVNIPGFIETARTVR